VYAKGELELVGFGVGVVERSRVIDGSSIGEGDVLLGLASNGVHSNGFSLVRQLLDEGKAAGKFDLLSAPPELNTSLAAALLAPTRLYVKSILNLVRDFTLKGIVHVTGGGFAGNVPRILSKGVCARIDPGAWPRPPIFGWLRGQGEISETEMLRVFNCGIGMIVVVAREDAQEIRDRLSALGERAWPIGRIERRRPEDPPLVFDPAPEG
jgi:phosphoribosylformylglycinamidine cyclo-ligase